jgi:hypothetical protein
LPWAAGRAGLDHVAGPTVMWQLGRQMTSIIAFIGQALASSALVIAGFIAVRFTKVGEHFLSHHLERKIGELKHAHDRDIESLRADLAHLQDRGRRANELEFDALTKVWHSFVDAWLKTQQAIVEFMSFPDLDNLSQDDLVTFLDSTELSGPQQNQVLSTKNKNEMYSKVLRLRTNNAAAAAIYEGRQTLRTNGIYISASTAKSFKEAFDKLSEAQVERYMEFQHGRSSGYEKSLQVLDTSGTGMLADLETLVRKAIRRD